MNLILTCSLFGVWFTIAQGTSYKTGPFLEWTIESCFENGGKVIYKESARYKVACEYPGTKEACDAEGGEFIVPPTSKYHQKLPYCIISKDLPPNGLKWASKIERPLPPCNYIAGKLSC